MREIITKVFTGSMLDGARRQIEQKDRSMTNNTADRARVEELLPVTQADRDAAASVAPPFIRKAVLRGDHDREGNFSQTVQAFARHRLASSPASTGDAPQSGDVGALRDAVENLVIGIGMGWDLGGLVARVNSAMLAAFPNSDAPLKADSGDVAAMREALRPFAAVADEYDDGEDDNFEVWVDAGPQRNIRSTFRLGLYRAARAALPDPTLTPGETS